MRFWKQCTVDGCLKEAARAGGLCQMHSWRLRFHGSVHHVRSRAPERRCSVGDCERIAKARGLCPWHSNRLKKGISFDWVRPQLAAKRYRFVKRPGHAVAMANGIAYVHRIVMFESIGMVRVPCFWCGSPVSFDKSDPHASPIVVDHYDHDRHNNAETNLRPSCTSCNAGRTRSNPHVRTPMYSLESAT